MNNIYNDFNSNYKGKPFDSNQDEYTFGEQYERRLEFKRRTGKAIKELEGELNKRQFISYTSLAQLTLLDSDLTLNDESASLELIRSRMVNLSYLIIEVEQGTNLSSICDNKVGLLLIERYNDNLTQVEFVSSDNLDNYKGIFINSIWSNWGEGVSKSKLDVEVLALEGKIDTNSDNISSNLVKIGTKQSKEDGKGLSSNDYTNEEKTKLEELYTKENLDLELDKKQNSTDELLETASKNVVGAINENKIKTDDNIEKIETGGYETITDITQDIELKEGYYEIVDNENNQYSVRVNSDLFISEGSVIENIAGHIRLKGVKMPCKLVIRQFPTLTNNTKYSFLELNSDFPSSEAIKSLIKEVI